MTEISKTVGIRELKGEEIDAVAGGGVNFSSPIEQKIFNVIDHIIQCVETELSELCGRKAG